MSVSTQKTANAHHKHDDMPSRKTLAGLFALLSAIFILVPTSARSRTVTDFNFDWEFHLGADANPLQDPASLSWEPVRLPHDWSIGLGFSQENTGCSTGFIPGGIGWYRKTFHAPEAWKGQHLELVFEGVYCRSEVYLNGRKIGGRPSGYVSFVTDLTPALNFGAPNTLLVKVDHSNYLDSRWYTGSGIYRNVRLVRSPQTRIPEWGVWIQTPAITTEEATVKVIADIVSPPGKKQDLQVKVEIRDPAGTSIVSSSQKITIDQTGQSTHLLKVKNPQRWNLETPNLYTASVSLIQDDQHLGTYPVRFGIRSSRFDPERGYLLNDKPVKIKGVNLHHDAGLVGAARPARCLERPPPTPPQHRLQRHPHGPQPPLCRTTGPLRRTRLPRHG